MSLQINFRQRFWRCCASSQRFVSLFWAPEIGWLLLVLGATWFVSMCTQDFRLWDSFCFLFSLNKDASCWYVRLFSGIVFLVVWLIGGGVLVSVLVAQRRRNDNGEFRLKTWLLRNHVVFLGWDENVPALMLKELKDGDNRLKKIFIVVTMNGVDDVVKSVAAANIEKWRLFVYRGFYDDDREREHLKVGNASSIYIIGENHEDSHDSRVVLLAKNMRSFVKNSPLPIYANISDFGLANRLIRNVGNSSLKDVRCLNFHLDSAAAMLQRVKGTTAFTHMVVIGFGAMGKAVVVKALELNAAQTVFVSDDDKEKFAMEKGRFDNQFSEYAGCVKGWSYSDCLDNMRKACAGENWLVVIAKHRSEKGLYAVWGVLSAIGDKSYFRLALNQEVKCDFWHDNATDQNAIVVDNRQIELFGFKRGDIANNDDY